MGRDWTALVSSLVNGKGHNTYVVQSLGAVSASGYFLTHCSQREEGIRALEVQSHFVDWFGHMTLKELTDAFTLPSLRNRLYVRIDTPSHNLSTHGWSTRVSNQPRGETLKESTVAFIYSCCTWEISPVTYAHPAQDAGRNELGTQVQGW